MRCMAAVISLFIAASAFASNPPKNTGNKRPPDWKKPPVGDWDFDNTPAIPDPTLRAAPGLATMQVSTLLLPQAVNHAKTLQTGGTSTSQGASLVPNNPLHATRTQGVVTLAGSKRFVLATVSNDVPGGLLNPIYTYDVSNSGSAAYDVEPSVISNNVVVSPQTLEATYHVTAWAHDPGTGHYGINTMSTSSLSSTGFTPGPITPMFMPSGYSDSGDNWTSENAFSDGIAPRRIYITGLMFNRDANNMAVNPSAIRTWYSDNGGGTWTGGWNIDQRDTGQFILDKPATDVSWYSGTRGYFYAAYVDLAAPQRVILREFTNGVQSGRCLGPGHCIPPAFTETVVTSDGNLLPQYPQVVVNSTNGHVYVFWVNTILPGSPEIRMRRSLDGTVTNLDPNEYVVANNYGLTGTVAADTSAKMKALSIPHARFNPVTNQVMLTWHGSDHSQSDLISSTRHLTPTRCRPHHRFRIELPSAAQGTSSSRHWTTTTLATL